MRVGVYFDGGGAMCVAEMWSRGCEWMEGSPSKKGYGVLRDTCCCFSSFPNELRALRSVLPRLLASIDYIDPNRNAHTYSVGARTTFLLRTLRLSITFNYTVVKK